MIRRLPTRLELLACTVGFVLMTFELAAARILAPTVGSSTYVWTSIIGTIIAALSFGFYMGGRVADARARRRDVQWLLLAAAGLIALTTVAVPLCTAMAGRAGDRRAPASCYGGAGTVCAY